MPKEPPVPNGVSPTRRSPKGAAPGPLTVPGLGSYLVQAQNSRDWMVIQNLVLIYGVVAVLVNIVVDLSYAWIDPRVRLA